MTCSDSLQGGEILRNNVYMQFAQIKVSVIILFVRTNIHVDFFNAAHCHLYQVLCL